MALQPRLRPRPQPTTLPATAPVAAPAPAPAPVAPTPEINPAYIGGQEGAAPTPGMYDAPAPAPVTAPAPIPVAAPAPVPTHSSAYGGGALLAGRPGGYPTRQGGVNLGAGAALPPQVTAAAMQHPRLVDALLGKLGRRRP